MRNKGLSQVHFDIMISSTTELVFQYILIRKYFGHESLEMLSTLTKPEKRKRVFHFYPLAYAGKSQQWFETIILFKIIKIPNFHNPFFMFSVIRQITAAPPSFDTLASIYGPRQANLCLRAFRHDKFQLRMPSHSEGPGIWLSV